MAKATAILRKNKVAYTDGNRVIGNKGGTRSSKTYSVLQLLLAIAYNNQLLISICSESLPHLKRGAMRDFMIILQSVGLVEEKNYKYNGSENIYRFGSGGMIEFFSVDNAGKVHGAQRDILYINECNHIRYETYRQLSVRTSQTIFLDWNPASDFWFEQHIAHRENCVLIHSTYKDNPFLSATQIEEIESNKHDTNWWRVYGLGLNGNREGLCVKNWEQCVEMPTVYKRRFLGLDFGFTNDPTVILDVRVSEGELWVDEVCYSSGMTNPDIAKEIKYNELQGIQIVADSAEPKSIQELKNERLKVEPAQKGDDSIRQGLDILARYKINVTTRSLNLIKELRNYSYKEDKDGKTTNVPIDKYNHAIDALRYVALNYLNNKPQISRAKIKTSKTY